MGYVVMAVMVMAFVVMEGMDMGMDFMVMVVTEDMVMGYVVMAVMVMAFVVMEDMGMVMDYMGMVMDYMGMVMDYMVTVVIEDMAMVGMVNIKEQQMIKMESTSLVSTSLTSMDMDTKASESLQNTFVEDIRLTL